ncbi:FecR family protein [Pseudobacter ginsenosidimutans]|nr:FecR family protein [Pseudobacter ginsenosidimutans]
MNPVDFKQIITAWLDGSLNEEGRKQLGKLLMLPEYQEQLDAIMKEQQQQGYAMQAEFEESYHAMRRELQSRVQPEPARVFRFWWAAAAAVVVLVAGVWFFNSNQKTTQIVAEQPKPAIEIPAGQEGAVLTLADGSKMILDSMGNGILSHQNGADLMLSNGQLEYKLAGEAAGEETYNTLNTPKGRQFRIMLPDGSVAWLNAASSIRFPTRFTKDVRRVEITGEVYFEAATVMRNGKKLPLVVNADNRFEVEVLGTHFNVNAYTDEPVLNTTLLEGKVAVTSTRSGEKVVLQPGEQASLQTQAGASRELIVRKADAGKVMAWKNGVFDFEDARIDEVMRQLKRWYDIDVKYESGIPDIEFVGKMTRDIPLNGLLIALKKSNVHFRLEGRTLIVTP